MAQRIAITLGRELVIKGIAATIIAVASIFGFGPTSWAAFIVTGLPTWVTPELAQTAFIFIAVAMGLLLLWPLLSRPWRRQTWAERDQLELSAIANLSVGKSADDKYDDEPQLSRHRWLKDAVTKGELQIIDMVGEKPNVMTRVSREALRAFALGSKHTDLIKFLGRWDRLNPPIKNNSLSGTDGLSEQAEVPDTPDSGPAPLKLPPVTPNPWWKWEAISFEQAEALFDALKDKPKIAVTVVCSKSACKALAQSLREVFRRLGWEEGSVAPPIASHLAAGVTGLAVNKSDARGQALRQAIETSLNCPVGIRVSSLTAVEERTIIIIGGKPIPTPLPPEAARQLSELGRDLRELASAIRVFASDRAREQTRTLGESAEWEKRSLFENETSVLFRERFGSALTRYAAGLTSLGIDQSFQVAAHSDRPLLMAEWFGLMGSFVEKESVADARHNSADEDFWFKKMTETYRG